MIRLRESNYLRRPGAAGIALLLAAAAICLPGCGGGGGGGTSSSPTPQAPTFVKLSGQITNSSGTGVSGWFVAFDYENSNAYTTTTDANGNYSISVPASTPAIADYLTIADTSGNIWYDGPASVGAANVTDSVQLPATDTVSGTVLTSASAAASGYTVVFKSGGTFHEPSAPTGTGNAVNVYYMATTSATGAYTLNIPLTLNLEGTVDPVITPAVKGVSTDELYVIDSSFLDWVTATHTTGAYPFTYSPTLASSPVTSLVVSAPHSSAKDLPSIVKANLKALLGTATK